MRTPNKAVALVALAALAPFGLAGCGDDSGDDSDGGSKSFADQSAEEIKDATIKDMQDVSSLTMTGNFTNDGQETALDLTTDVDGRCTGTMTINGGQAQIISTGTDSFLKADEAFWTASAGDTAPQIIAVLGDKWAKLPADNDFAEVCDLDQMLDEFNDTDDDKKATVGDVTEIDGQDAVEIKSEDENGESSTAWIAVDGKHHILKLSTSEGDEPGEFTFTNYDEEVDAQAPADDQVVPLG
ncbi:MULTISPECIES: hypothetical protein [unclassified Nocardioides]|uniref:hypothetical protein n=1 Tax=unclassified Nocardioides TaxID=2615069 RepID=UPI0006FEFCC7|nr:MULTISPECIES: hypothetical protein [unclassified Nocardioides]KQY57201.1 hypothetical protein ASD30_13235 [Nocardioides sp. Root140]KRF11844.1 hypothetical protein ASH02_17905 [Nocardioides sp. Soil796]